MKSILDEPAFFSLVYYFVSRPKRAAEIIAATCEQSAALLGPVRPYLRWGLRRFERGRHPIRYTLDSSELLSGFARDPDEGLNLMLPPRKSKRIMTNDFVWLLEYDPDPVDSIHFEPILGVHFGIPYLTEAQALRLRDFSELLTEVVVKNAEVCHALADLGAVSLAARGGLYHARIPLYVPLDRLIRRRVWLRLGEQRKRKLRGVFWGQVLSPWMVGQLGGADRFIDEYRSLEDPVNTNLVRTFPDGSMFVCLSNSPLDVRPPNPFSTPPVIGPLPPMIDRAVWLHERFTEAGLL